MRKCFLSTFHPSILHGVLLFPFSFLAPIELLGESARVFMKEPAKNQWFFDFFKVLKILQLHIKTG
jgi:hypothetical protein